MKKYFNILLFTAAVTGLTSCLKDDNANLTPDSSPAVVEFSTIHDNPVSTGGGYTFYTRSFDIAPSMTLSIDVNYTGGSPVSGDATVEIGLNPAAVDAYNTAHENDDDFEPLEVLDASLYTLPTSVVIKSGERKGALNVALKTDGFDLNANYVLPLQVKSTTKGGVSANYSTILMGVKAKNEYEAQYTATGYVFHPSSPRAIDDTYTVGTAGPISVTVPMADLGSAGYLFKFDINGSALSNYVAQSATPAAPASGFMTLDNPGNVNYSSAAPNAPGQGEFTSANYNNTYDPATQTFLLHFGYASGGNGQATFSRQFYMKLVRE